MKVIALLSVVGACSFTPSTADQPEADASLPSGDDAPPPDGPNASVAPCSTPDPLGLVLCLEMEDDVGDGTLQDSSSGRRDAAAQNLTAAMRTVPGNSPAIEINSTTIIRVAEDPVFDRDAGYTTAMWIRPSSLPVQGTVYGLLDHEEQYAMLIGRDSVSGGLQNRCAHTGVERFEFTEQLAEDTWSFLACTWDGTDFCAWRWTSVGSHERFCHRPDLPPNATGSQGVAIGHLSDGGAPTFRFDGALDSVQIYDRGLTENQLCAMIGQPNGCMPCTICEK